jgi:phosphoribosyl-AMP cyclohydrolase / phosphoribosyl-ATP pyrophosphohydrolase
MPEPAADAGPGPPGLPLAQVDAELLETVAFDSRGLVPAIVQDADGGEVLMLAHMNREALARTIASGRSWFWSRSRNSLWCKGETSGDRQYVREVRVDCDGDAVLLLVDQHGDAACHTKEWSCFYRLAAHGPGVPKPDDPGS